MHVCTCSAMKINSNSKPLLKKKEIHSIFGTQNDPYRFTQTHVQRLMYMPTWDQAHELSFVETKIYLNSCPWKHLIRLEAHLRATGYTKCEYLGITFQTRRGVLAPQSIIHKHYYLFTEGQESGLRKLSLVFHLPSLQQPIKIHSMPTLQKSVESLCYLANLVNEQILGSGICLSCLT